MYQLQNTITQPAAEREREHNESFVLINLFGAILKYFSSRAFPSPQFVSRAGIPSSDFKLLD